MRPGYFHDMYAVDPDPWGFTSRWYERRKYALTLAALPRARYRHVFEPGCSVGVLSEQLAARADRLLACDLVPTAVEQTSARLTASTTARDTGVDVRQWDLRGPWPETTFDLIVVSEVLYYLEPAEAQTFMTSAVAHLDADGHLVSVHWQPAVPDYPLSGAEAQRIACTTDGLSLLAHYEDGDVVLDVLGRGPAVSVAQADGLR